MPGAYDREKKSAITRSISSSYYKALSSYFGSGKPDLELAKGSHRSYVAALEAHGTDVIVLPGLDEHPDCCFVEDTAIMVDDKAVISNMGHDSRKGEEVAIKEYLSNDFEIINMPKKCSIDGGDVVFFDDRFLIGISTRTNQIGANFLGSCVKDSGYDVEYIDIPSSTLHLTTVCSSPRPGTMILAEGHLNAEKFDFVDEIITTPNSESYAANVLGYSNDRNNGFSITSVDMAPIMEADGSLTCLSVYIN
jgi:dimethylargininase